jgi:hypothetical protein
MPSRRLDQAGWLRPPRLPLGDPWGGTCHAQPADIVEPLESLQREVCNSGYARGRCERFPADAPDAVRFSVTHEAEELVRLVYLLEKDHAPAEHGFLEFADGRATGEAKNELLAQQARAFVESHLRQRARAQAATVAP